MGLEDLDTDVTEATGELGDTLEMTLDRETRTELAMLIAAMEPTDPDEIVRRAVHAFFQQQVETGRLDLQLRRQYDASYDEYLYPVPEDAYSEQRPATGDPDDRRYQF